MGTYTRSDISSEIFYDLPDLKKGDEITVEDASGGEYVYRVSMKKTVGPRDVEVMNPPQDGSVVTLQTCTLPNYEDRIIVQGELVESKGGGSAINAGRFHPGSRALRCPLARVASLISAVAAPGRSRCS